MTHSQFPLDKCPERWPSLRPGGRGHKMKTQTLQGRRVRRATFIAASSMLVAASIPLRGEEPVVSAGKEHAARSAVEWTVSDTDHPLLGPIRFAAQKDAIATTAGREKIVSRAFVSCQKSSGKVAIELTNAPESDLAGGLRPTELPRLVCSSPGPRGNKSLVKSELVAQWEIRPLGDMLARGLSASELRRCVSIAVVQKLAPPPGSSTGSPRIAMDIPPYNKALDAVFAACGEASAFATGQQVPPPVAPAVRQGRAPEGEASAPAAPAPWIPARTTTTGRTNVRAAANTYSRVVVKLEPDTRILVRRTVPSWWEARPRSGEAFRGYVREDRVAFD